MPCRAPRMLHVVDQVWNWMFDQTSYASRMGALAGLTAGDRHLTWYATRSVQIFNIFDQVMPGGLSGFKV